MQRLLESASSCTQAANLPAGRGPPDDKLITTAVEGADGTDRDCLGA